MTEQGSIIAVLDSGTAYYTARLPMKEAVELHAILGGAIEKARNDRRAGYKVDGEPPMERVRRRPPPPSV